MPRLLEEIVSVGDNKFMQKPHVFSIFLWTAVFLFLNASAFAQLTISSPNSNTRLKACDEYSTTAFADPWDMSNQADINNYIQSDMSGILSPIFTAGVFSFVTSGESSTFHLLSPNICGATPSGGRYGVKYPIDVSKYTQLTMRMFTDKYDAGGGFKMIWHRGCDYTKTRTVTAFQPTKTGWGNYKINLNSIAISSGESSNTGAWSGGSINGLAILPTHRGDAQVYIDSVRIEDPTSCGSTNVSYSATAQGGKALFSMFLDDDTDPLNGYHTQLISGQSTAGASSLSASTSGLAPGSYYISGFLTDDYATAVRNDPWEMTNEEDIVTAGGVSGGTFSGGNYSGTTTGAGASTIYLRLGDSGLNADSFSKLSFKISNSGGSIQIFAQNNSGVIDGFTINGSHSVGGDVYNVNLATAPWGSGSFWTGTMQNLIVRPSTAGGATFSIDWVSVGQNNFINAGSQLVPTVVTAGGQLLVNSPPLVNMVKPDIQGGEAIRPWNMNTGDLVVFTDLRNDTDPGNPSEPYSAFLPDVRRVDGVRGDFFKGTNVLGVDHAVNYSTFPLFNDNPIKIDSSIYKHLSVKMFNDHETDVCLGSIIRPYWLHSDNVFTTALAAVTINNRWTSSRWYEYYFHLPTAELNDPSQRPWTGVLDGFRVDPNEFHLDTCSNAGVPSGNGISVTYYYDYIKLRKDFEANNQFAFVYGLSDADDNASLNLYYNANRSTSGGTLINGSALQENANSRVHLWDTSGVPDGTYYIYSTADDGLNTVTRFADNPITINHSLSRSVTQPILSVETPTDSLTVCDSLQVKGYSLMDRFEDVATVQVALDGQRLGNIQPSVFSVQAKAAYPTLDSSNSGFDETYSIASFGNGAHTLTVTAYSTDGQTTTVTRSITKAGAGCPSVVTDPEPSGSPGTITVGVGNPTATPVPSPSISKASISKKGAVTIGIKNAFNGSSCSLSLKIGKTAKKLTNSASGFTATKSTVTLTGTKIGISKSKVPSFALQVTRTCGETSKTTTTKTVKVPAMSIKQSVKSIGSLAKALKKLKVS